MKRLTRLLSPITHDSPTASMLLNQISNLEKKISIMILPELSSILPNLVIFLDFTGLLGWMREDRMKPFLHLTSICTNFISGSSSGDWSDAEMELFQTGLQRWILVYEPLILSIIRTCFFYNDMEGGMKRKEVVERVLKGSGQAWKSAHLWVQYIDPALFIHHLSSMDQSCCDSVSVMLSCLQSTWATGLDSRQVDLDSSSVLVPSVHSLSIPEWYQVDFFKTLHLIWKSSQVTIEFQREILKVFQLALENKGGLVEAALEEIITVWLPILGPLFSLPDFLSLSQTILSKIMLQAGTFRNRVWATSSPFIYSALQSPNFRVQFVAFDTLKEIIKVCAYDQDPCFSEIVMKLLAITLEGSGLRCLAFRTLFQCPPRSLEPLICEMSIWACHLYLEKPKPLKDVAMLMDQTLGDFIDIALPHVLPGILQARDFNLLNVLISKGGKAANEAKVAKKLIIYSGEICAKLLPSSVDFFASLLLPFSDEESFGTISLFKSNLLILLYNLIVEMGGSDRSRAEQG